MKPRHMALGAVLLGMASGCRWEEALLIENLKGTVRVPIEAATRTIIDVDGVERTVTDTALIGPVFLGLYPSISPEFSFAPYPHPTLDQQRIAHPYGGTTVGDIRFACFESMSCKVTSGRFRDWEHMFDWFRAVGQPVLDAEFQPVPNSEVMRHQCYDLLDVVSDDEVRITGDLDFELTDDGQFYEASFEILQQEFFTKNTPEGCTPGQDCEGMQLWGWMDSPSPQDYVFTSCVESTGFDVNVYDSVFSSGAASPTLLNQPSERIGQGDWVSWTPVRWDDINEEPTLVLDYEVE